MLRNISTDQINDNREKVYGVIQQVFSDIQNVSGDININEFIERLTSLGNYL